MSFWGFIGEVAYIVAAFALFSAFACLWVLYKRGLQPKKARSNQTVQEFTNMLILLQTMRGIIHQQKVLARRFNENLERKVGQLKAVMSAALEENERLREAQRVLAAQFEDLKNDLEALQTQAAYLKEKPQEGCRVEEPGPEPLDEDEPEPEESEPVPAFSAADEFVERDEATDIVEHWAGLDFSGVREEREEFVVPEAPPEKPENPARAREAFRALLNMDMARAEEPAEKEEAAPADAKDDPGNGRDRAASLRSRVYEYSDAGMNVSQIAREMGVGKGEVRLILTLREKQS